MARAPLDIRLLNDLEVIRDGHPLDLPNSRKTRALLGYLVVSATPERRERLCDLFFDGPSDPRAALRWSLTKLRTMLDDADAQRLVATRDQVQFERHGARVDLLDARARIGGSTDEAPTDALRDVAPRLRGTLLAGLDLPDCYAYGSWLAAQRDALRSLRQSVLSTLVRRLRTTPEDALGYARELLAVDPFDDSAYAAVIELLGASGRVHDARAEYETCRRIMKRELGREPRDDVERALGEAEARGRIHVPRFARDDDAPEVRSEVRRAPRISFGLKSLPNFVVGRSSELALLSEIVERRTAAADCDVVLVTGEPGIGKSRLLEELGTMVTAAGGVVLRGRAFEAEMIRPYGPWVDALPDIVAIPSPESGVRDRHDLFDTARRLVSASAPRDAVVAVLLDDLQWFDDASVALLHFIARGPSDTRIIIGLSARTATLASNTAASTAVRAMRRTGRLRELPLGPLSDAEIATLATSANSDVDAGQVAAASGGNPLYALAVTRSLAAGETVVSGSIESIIDEHLATLNDRARELIMWAAALGTSFTPATLGLAADCPTAELLVALEELEVHGVIHPAAGVAAYDFSHDLVRRAAYGRIAPARRRAMHLAIAQRLVAVDDPRGELASDIAAQALAGGDPELAARACAQAAEHCMRVFAFEEARALASRGLEALRDPSTRELIPLRRRVVLETELEGIRVHAGGARGNEAETQAALHRLAEEARTLGLNAQLHTAHYLESYIHFIGGDWALAEADTRLALDAGRGADEETAVRSMALSGRCLASIERDLTLSRSLLDESTDRAAALGLRILDLSWGRGILAHHDGNLDAAVAEFISVVRDARVADQYWPLCDCLVRLACVELERGRFVEARKHCADLAPVAARLGEASERPFGEAIDALAALSMASGDDKAGLVANAQLNAALSSLDELDAKGSKSYVLNTVAGWHLANARNADAEHAATAALQASETVGRRSESIVARALLARLALREGRLDEAERLCATNAAASECELASARARAAVAGVRAIAIQNTTLAPTPSPTPAP
ncbi:MAG: AAA family ATPase [bacterium]